MKTAILICLLLAAASAKLYYTSYDETEPNNGSEKSSGVAAIPEQWFDQKLDHFTPLNNATWAQRYFVMDHWFNATLNPVVILYICGESECNGVQYNSSFTSQLASNFSGIVFSVEHRFYGKSQPFGYSETSYSAANLKYLTAQQALADLAWFIRFAKDNKIFGITANMPWITIGGSYPGALSAWFRYKYPHLTIGALASSAVVNSIVDFYEFDQGVSDALSKQTGNSSNCRQVVHNINNEVTYVLENGTEEEKIRIKKFFTNDTSVSNGDFMFYFSDITVMGVQYGRREAMCELITSDLSFYGILNNISKYGTSVGVTLDQYDVQSLRKTAYGQTLNQRQWYYQVCSEFGWLFTPAKHYAMRSSILDMGYWTNWCKDAYDGAFPNSDGTNNDFGGLDIQATNLIFTNGSEDPWQWASKRTSSKGMQSYIAECNQCAHCVDLRTPSPNDSFILKAIRKQTTDSFAKWIHEFYHPSSDANPIIQELIKPQVKQE